MRGATCFSGIGAPEVAMPWVDWVWHSEIEPFPCAVMAQRHPNNLNLGDILAPDFIDRAKALGPLDLMVGGPPCQAFSIAGLRQSLADPRGNLSLRWVQVLHAIRPTIAITENVPGWLSTGDNAFGCFLAGIVGADAPLNSPLERGRWPNHGMVAGPLARAAWRVLDAQYVRTRTFPWAVPQRRRRVFVVISFGTTGPDPAAVLFDRESLRGNPAPRREAGQSAPGHAGKSPDRCSVDGCDRPKAKRGWCNSHYQRWRASGNPGSGPVNAPNRPDHERFWEKVDRSGECWTYTGSLNEKGYGIFWSNSEQRTMRAHRFAFEDQVGPIPEGMQLDHLCRNPACCRPSHLEPVTSGENTRRGNAGKHWAEKRGEVSDVAPTLAARTRGGGGLGTDFDCDGGLIAGAPPTAFGGGNRSGPIDKAATLVAKGHKCDFEVKTFVAHSLRAEGFDGSEDGTGRGTPIVPVQHTRDVAGALAANYGKQPDSSDTGLGPNLVSHPIAIQERAMSENPDAGPDGKGWRDDGAAYTLEARQVSQAVAAPVDSAFTFNTTQLTSPQNGQDLGPDKLCHSLAAKDHPPAVAIAFTAKDHGGDAIEGISPTLRAGDHTGSHANAGVMPAIAFPAEMSATQCASTEELSPALCVKHTTAVAFKIGAGAQAGSIGIEEEVSPTLTSSDSGTQRSPGMLNAWGVRRLTPTECARLQGFPDDWTRIPWRGKPAEECPDGPQYRCYGNSMAVNVMCWIGERLQAVIAAGEGA